MLAAESRAEQQMGRLRSELEQAELAAQAMDFLSERKKNITVGEEELLKCEKCDLNSPMTKGRGSMMFGDGLIKVNDGWRWSVMFDVGRGSFVIADPSAGCLCSQCHRDYPPLGYRKYQLSTRWWNRISCQHPGFSSFFPYFHDNYISCAGFFSPEKIQQPISTRESGAVSASESALKPRLQQAHAEARYVWRV